MIVDLPWTKPPLTQNRSSRCPACPFPDDRPNCCHDGDLS